MYAIVDIAGQQFKVEKDKKIFVHRLEGEEGSKVEFDQILLIDDNGKVKVGTPIVKDMIVTAKIVSHLKSDKVKVFKKKRRKGYKVLNGHRQFITELLIENIAAGQKKAAPEAKKASAPAAKAEKPAAKKEAAPKKETSAKPKATTAKEEAAVKTEAKAKPAAKKPAAKPKATPAAKKESTAKKASATKKVSPTAEKKTTKKAAQKKDNTTDKKSDK
ncbi:MAG: 50S ribosomal protein L21 [Bacteroidales bacterium]|nr:50S ribosomal protein L21 [Bacteroidales bacterium]